MVSSLYELEQLLKLLRLPYRRVGDSIVASYEDERFGSIGLAFSLEKESNTLRVAAPLDVEPTEEGLRVLLEENFTSTTYKYAIDYEGFIAVVYDVPADCVKDPRTIRTIILHVIDGARRVLERSKREEG